MGLLERLPGARGDFSVTHRKEYIRWYTMVRRCHDPSAQNYERYGGRGIEVCAEWRNDPVRMYHDMGFPDPGKSLERKDNDGNYCKENCKWASAKEQAQNRRNSVRVRIVYVLE